MNQNLEQYQVKEHSSMLIARVFEQKINALMDYLTVKQIFGKVDAYIQVTEWQKRGYSHAHILITLREENKIRGADMIDRIVSAQIPDPEDNPDLYRIVKDFMRHGPCGKINKNCACMQKDKKHCDKKYILNIFFAF